MGNRSIFRTRVTRTFGRFLSWLVCGSHHTLIYGASCCVCYLVAVRSDTSKYSCTDTFPLHFHEIVPGVFLMAFNIFGSFAAAMVCACNHTIPQSTVLLCLVLYCRRQLFYSFCSMWEHLHIHKSSEPKRKPCLTRTKYYIHTGINEYSGRLLAPPFVLF